MKNLAQIKWHKIVRRRLTPLSLYGFFIGNSIDIKNYIGVGIDTNFVGATSPQQLAVDAKKLIELGKLIEKKIRQDPDFVNQHVNDCYQACQVLVKTGKRVSSGDLSSLDSLELLERLQKFQKLWHNFAIFLTVPHSIEKVIGTKLEGLFKTLNLGEISLADLLIAPRYPQSTIEQHELTFLAQKIKQRRIKNLNKLLKKHYQQYRWLSVYEYDEEPLKLQHFESRLKSLLNSDLDKRINEIQKEKRQIREADRRIKTNIKGKLLSFLTIFREYLFLRSYRTEMMRKARFYFQLSRAGFYPMLLSYQEK